MPLKKIDVNSQDMKKINIKQSTFKEIIKKIKQQRTTKDKSNISNQLSSKKQSISQEKKHIESMFKKINIQVESKK